MMITWVSWEDKTQSLVIHTKHIRDDGDDTNTDVNVNRNAVEGFYVRWQTKGYVAKLNCCELKLKHKYISLCSVVK